MGMANSAQAFQRLVESVVGDLPGTFCYLDDLLVYSKSQKEHLETLDILFKKLEGAGLTLALAKCQFGMDSVDYLGYTISKDGLKPIQKKGLMPKGI